MLYRQEVKTREAGRGGGGEPDPLERADHAAPRLRRGGGRGDPAQPLKPRTKCGVLQIQATGEKPASRSRW